MSKIAVIGDIHLATVEKYGKFNHHTGLNTRTEDKLKALDSAVEVAVRKEVNAIFFLGDVFEISNPSERLKNLFFKTLLPAIEDRIPIIIVLGNHDMGVGVHSFLSTKTLDHEYVRICDRVRDFTIGGTRITLAPYGTEDDVVGKTGDILLGHLELLPCFSNAKYHMNILQENFTVFRNGHFHKRGEAHTGSLVAYKRDEFMAPHCIDIIDIKTLDVEPVEIEDRPLYAYDFSVGSLEKWLGQVEQPAFSEEAVVSIKAMDTKPNLDSLNVQSIKSMFDVHKVVVEKEQIKSDKTVERKLGKSSEFDIALDMETYCREKKQKEDMLEFGRQITKQVAGG